MAVVGHAQVVVRAITDKVQGDIEKAFKGSSNVGGNAGRDMGSAFTRSLGRSMLSGAGNAFQNLSKNIRMLYPEAEGARKQFVSLSRTSFTLQAALGALAGSLGAVVGGLGALIGAAGAGAASLVAVGSAAITAGVGIRIASYALGGISQAVKAATQANGGYRKSLKELQFDQEEAALSVARAELNLQKARNSAARTADLAPNNVIRREAELAVLEAEAALRRAKNAEKNGADGGGGADPFAGLTPSQRKFAEFLVSIQGMFDKLKEAAAKGFLPLLQAQIEKLISSGFFEVLEKKYERLAIGAGKAVENFTDIFLAGDNLNDFYKILDNMAEILPTLGTILGNTFGGFLSIMEAADPLTRKFVDFLERKSGSLAAFLDTKQASGELEEFFNQAGIIGAKFGEIFGNVFAGFGSLIRANFGPGSGGYTLLEWLDKATEGWRNLDLISQEKYFKGAADNFIAMANAIGGAIDTIIQRGADPAIKDFWETLDRGSYAFDQIVRSSVESAPALADFLKAMTDIIAIFTDSGQVQAFFGTLTTLARGALAILEPLKPALDFAGVLLGVVSAVGLVMGAIKLLFLAGMGMVGFFTSMLPVVATNFVALTRHVGFATAAMTLFNLTNPLGWITLAAVAIGGLVAAFGAIQGAQTEKAVAGITQSFKDNASASTVWKEASLANSDGWVKDTAADMSKFKENLNAVDQAGGAYSRSAGAVNTQVRQAFKASLDAVGKSLANLAVTDLPNAQAQFKKFTDQTKLSRDEQVKALDNMDEYTNALKNQAEQMGIEITNQQGLIDKQKLLDFARGEGEIATRLAEQAQKDLNDSITNAAKGFVDYQGGLTQNKDDVMAWAKQQADSTADANDSWKDYWDGQEFSMEHYLDGLEEQQRAAAEWQTNISKLTGKLTEEVLNEVVGMGEAGVQLVAALTDGVNDAEEIRRLNATGTNIGFQLGGAVTAGLKSNLPQGVSLRQLMQKDGGYISTTPNGYQYNFASGGFVSGLGTARSDSIPAMLSNGEYVINARATANNRKLLDAINSNANIPNSAPNINVTVNASPGMDERELATMVSRKIAFEVRKGAF